MSQKRGEAGCACAFGDCFLNSCKEGDGAFDCVLIDQNNIIDEAFADLKVQAPYGFDRDTFGDGGATGFGRFASEFVVKGREVLNLNADDFDIRLEGFGSSRNT